MKKLILFFSILQKLTFGQIAPVDTVVLRIDPETAIGGTSKNIYNEITYIPLENSKACVVGEISKLEVVDNYYIVFDRGLDQIIIFNQDGSYHAKCVDIPELKKNSNMSNNPNFNKFGAFAVNRISKEIFVKTNLDRGNLYVFDYNGNFKRKSTLKTTNDNLTRFFGFAFLDSDRCVYNVPAYSPQKPSSAVMNHMLYYSNNFLSDHLNELAYNPATMASGMDVQLTFDGPFYYFGAVDKRFFTRSYDYNLYLLDKEGINQIFKMLLPLHYSIPNDFLTNEEKYRSKRIEYLTINSQKVYLITDVYRFGDYLTFKLNSNKYGEKNTFLYNLKTGNLLNLLRVTADDSTFFLPTINYSRSIAAGDGNYLYSTFSSLELFRAHEATKSKQPKYPAQLKDYFSNQTSKSNPVIVKIKLQQSL
jgi:hypothetical protein